MSAVTAKLWAGMGNQMFMIAAALGYAKKHGTNYFLPPTTIAPHIWKTHFPQFPTQRCPPHYVNYKEPRHSYSEIPKMDFIEIEGYFQSAKYFNHCKDFVIDSFQIPYKIMEGYVSIHVRRGDYLLYPDKHPVITIEYITEAVKFFLDKGYKNFIVCSDDIKWCRVQMKQLEQMGAELQFSSGRDHYQDLALLSCAEHQICSNSSYSWWGYYLNRNPDKIGIMPERWFGPGNYHLATFDLYPEGVIKM